MKRVACSILSVLLVMSQAVRSAPPRLVNYQGRLTNSSGAPLVGTYEITFRLYGSWVGGTALWSDVLTVSADSNGVFSTILGTPNPLSPSHFNGDERYLSLQVTGASEQTPRTLLTFAPMTFHALESESAISAPNYLPLAGGTMTGPTIHNLTTSRWQVGGSDKIVINPVAISDSSVVLPDSAVNAQEMLNEPGIAASYMTSTTVLTCGVISDVLAVDMTIPGPGYIVVEANGTAYSSASSSGAVIGGAVGINQTSLNPLIAPHKVSFEFQMPAGVYNFIKFPFGTHRVYYKSTPGAYTFHLYATRYGNCGASWESSVSNCMMKATYYPTSYGTVATLVPPSDAGQFERAEALSVPTGPDGKGPATTMYQVDLRELELKAAKLRIETERVERLLLEAKIKQAGEKSARH